MNILLVCSAGMSTSMLVEKMKDAADNRGIDANILALPAAMAADETADLDLDVILVGPQASFALNNMTSYAEEKKCPIEVISPQLYGTFDGGKVLDYALELIADYQNGL